MRYRFSILWALFAFTPAMLAGAQSRPTAPAPRAVATQFSDGRTTHHIVKPEGAGAWTTLFPRVAGADTDRNSLPLSALDVAIVPDGQNVKVGVTLIYGRPHQHRIAVATVTVTPSGPVRVEQLAAYGVEPVAFSIVPVPPSLLEAPTVTTVSASLETRVELAREDGPTFRVVVVNQSSLAVRGFGIEGTRAGRKSMSAYRKGQRHALLIPPGGAFSFEVPSSVIEGIGGTTRVSPDRVAISSVTWEDGTVDGDRQPAEVEHVIAAGSARQVANVLALLQDAGDVLRPQALPELRGRIAALAIDVNRSDAGEVHKTLPAPEVLTVDRVEYGLRLGMQQVRQLVLTDLDAFVNEVGRSSTALWISKTIAAYEEWLGRAQKASLSARR